ncbi:MAG: hypothetical protein RLZZ618_1737, partial [Pseudomonadota bacterium]
MSLTDMAINLPDASPPAGAPDPALLARLANEFFLALPGSNPSAGGVVVAAHPQPAGLVLPPGAFGPSTPSAVPFGALPPGANLVPTSPQSPANAVASAPVLVPNAVAPNGVPDHLLAAGPAYDSRSGGQLLGVPEAHALHAPQASAGGASSSLPSSPTSPSAASASPFYFVGDAGRAPQPPALKAPVSDPLQASSFGLPGSDVLRGLLSESRHEAVSAAPASSTAGGAAPATGFYFLDTASSPAVSPGAAKQQPLPQAAASAHPPFDVHAIRRDFPILSERVNGHQLVWFDNAATTQKPKVVMDRITHFYEHENSNIHRAAHELAARATDAYEKARETVRRFIGAGSTEEIIFVRGTTEGINLIAKSWGAKNIGPGDEIIVSHLEHHANIVPWQQLASAKGAKLRVIPVDDTGQVLLEEFQKLLNDRTKLVSVTHVSNALGTVVPVKKIIDLAHRAGARVLVDGAQSISHMRVDVRALDADFFVFSGHKIFGPTGIGAVYGKRDVLEDMPPWQGGGNMIADVTFER